MNHKSTLPAVLVAAFLLNACGRSDQTTSQPPPPTTNTAERIFSASGVVRSVPESGHTLVVRHEEIPNYMPRMTMELNVRDTNELAGLERDDEITFQLVATADTHWIQNIKRIGKAPTSEPPVVPTGFTLTKELKPGDAIPDYEFLAENGQRIHFSDYRGRVLAFTFFFTRCPLPDFCPRMGNNFAAAREMLMKQTNAPTNWQFLSISFDSEFDAPEVLRSHAKFYRHDNTNRWLFAVASAKVLATLAPELDLTFAREASGSISHNLRTVVLDPQGRIHRQFDGNQWTPEELAQAMQDASAAN